VRACLIHEIGVRSQKVEPISEEISQCVSVGIKRRIIKGDNARLSANSLCLPEHDGCLVTSSLHVQQCTRRMWSKRTPFETERARRE
jgi:hypothetical protein